MLTSQKYVVNYNRNHHIKKGGGESLPRASKGVELGSKQTRFLAALASRPFSAAPSSGHIPQRPVR